MGAFGAGYPSFSCSGGFLCYQTIAANVVFAIGEYLCRDGGWEDCRVHRAVYSEYRDAVC